MAALSISSDNLSGFPMNNLKKLPPTLSKPLPRAKTNNNISSLDSPISQSLTTQVIISTNPANNSSNPPKKGFFAGKRAKKGLKKSLWNNQIGKLPKSRSSQDINGENSINGSNTSDHSPSLVPKKTTNEPTMGPLRNVSPRLAASFDTSSLRRNNTLSSVRPRSAWRSFGNLPFEKSTQHSQESHLPPLGSIPIYINDMITSPVSPKDFEVLVVGTEKFTCALVATYLKEMDYQVQWIEHGFQALELLSSDVHRFDLIFYSLMDQDIHGYDFLIKMHESNIRNNIGEKIPVILLSTGGGIETTTTALRLGAADLLCSPITIEVLKSRTSTYFQLASLKSKLHKYSHTQLKDIVRHHENNNQRLVGTNPFPEPTPTEQLQKENEALRGELSEIKTQLVNEKMISIEAKSLNQKKDYDIQKKISEAFNTPLQIITKVVKNLSKSKSIDNNDLKKSLLMIMNSLSSNDLFSPGLEKIFSANLNEKWSNREQDMAKCWIVAHFTKKMLHPRSRRASLINGQKVDPNTGTIYDMEEINKRIYVVSSWEFYVWSYSDDELLLFIIAMFKDLSLLETFNIPVKKLLAFLRAIKSRYQNNPYHNFQHAFDVTQMMYLILKHSSATDYITTTDVLAIMLGALCHDVEHPGLNNNFQVATRTELSIVYNDQSVLENHHSSTSWRVLSNLETNVLSNLNPDEEKEVRRIMTTAILATDMSAHFELISKFGSKIDTDIKFDRNSKEDRQLFCNIMLHAADISNLCRPYETSKRWSDNLFDEMLNQGDAEKLKGIPISPYMDRDNSDQVKLTLNFADFIVIPLFKKLIKFLPQLEICLKNTIKNRSRWEDYKPPKKNEVEKITVIPSKVDVSYEGILNSRKPLPTISKKP